MAELAGIFIETTLGSDDPTVELGGQDFGYGSLRIGDSDASIRMVGGTASRSGDLQRLHAMLSRGIDLIESAIAQEAIPQDGQP